MKPASEILAELAAKGLRRELKHLDAAQSPRTMIDGHPVINFSSNNYLGLCDDPRLKNAAIQTIQTFGTGSGASRLIAGGSAIHRKLELTVADWLETENSILFNTGYMANVGTISALADNESIIFCDRLNHASIFDGVKLSGAKLVPYKHKDLNDLRDKAIRFKGRSGLIITDGIFSMDGDIAPLPELLALAEKFAWPLIVDDAHAIGVLGASGRGTIEHFNLKSDLLIRMGTFSKALGSEGGFVAASHEIIQLLIHSARSFVYSTALPAGVAAASLCAVQILQKSPQMSGMLRDKTKKFTKRLNQNGLSVEISEVPIIPLIIGSADETTRISKHLFEKGIYIPAIRPPTVPEGTSRLRLSISLGHTDEELLTASQITTETIHEMSISNHGSKP